MKRFRPRLTYANVVASLALFIALGGAAVAAGLPKNSIGPQQLKKGAVTAKALRKQAVTSGKIAPKAVVAGKLGPNAVLPGNLGAGIIDKSKISAGAVTAEKIANNVVTTNKLNNAAVTSQKIAQNGVATSNIAEGAVTVTKIGKASVTAEKLAPEVLNKVNPLGTGLTLRGVFNLGGTEEPASTEPIAVRDSISFQQPLLATPTVEVLAKGAVTTNCKGLGGGGTTPEAAPGFLCFYLTTETNLETGAALATEGPNRLGTGLVTKAKKASKGEFVAAGVWAVTAP